LQEKVHDQVTEINEFTKPEEPVINSVTAWKLINGVKWISYG